MDTPDFKPAEYMRQHRVRPSRENGSVRLVGKKAKKWEGTYHIYPNGQRQTMRRIIGTKAEFPTKAQALDHLRAWLRRQQNQPVADTGERTVAELADDYLAVRKGGWEQPTQATIASVIENLIKPAIGGKAIAQVKPEDLKRLVDDLPGRTKLPGGRGVSISYAKKTITTLRGMFDLAEERELITKNPARSVIVRLKIPRQAAKPDKTVFPPQYLPRLLAQLDRRDQLIVRLSLLGATRPNELFGLTGADVGPGWIHVRGSLDRRRARVPTKTGGERFLHVPPELDRDLHGWLEYQQIGPTEPVFPNRDGNVMDRANFLNRRLRPAAERAKIPVLDIDFQMLRRSFATLGQILGLDVKAIQAQLGHARPDMTASVYMQSIDQRTAQQLAQFEDMLAGRAAIPVNVEAQLGKVVVQ